MKLLKKLLAGLGVVFSLLLLVAGSLLYLSSRFRDEHEPFIREFMSDYSRRWETADVYDRLAPECLEQIQSPNGEQAVASFRRLGRLLEITDISLQNFYAGTGGKSGIFVFKARFEAAPALVHLAIREADSQVRVVALNVTPSAELQQPASNPTHL